VPPPALAALPNPQMEVAFDAKAVRDLLPQRGTMDQLDGVYQLDLENHIIWAYKVITEQEFWIAGHFPDRPLMPGVIQLEALAQCCMFLYKSLPGNADKSFGFGGLESVVFRKGIVPGDRLEIVAKVKRMQSRRFSFDAQGFLGEQLAVSAVIMGVPI